MDDASKLREFTRLYSHLRAEMDQLPSVIAEPEKAREAWARVLAYMAEIEKLFPPSAEPLSHQQP